MGDKNQDWLCATVSPGQPLEVMLVPEIKSNEVAANRKTFYYGINRWSTQWQQARPNTRWRNEVPTVPIDGKHLIATLKDCITGTVTAYQNATSTLQPQMRTQKSCVERVIYHGLGHGSLADATHATTADFGCQLGGFSQHEFRVSTVTFDVYRQILAANNFNISIPWNRPGMPQQLMTSKEKAQQLLIFDGLCAIRQAAKSVVNRIRLVTCNVGADQAFLDQLTWTLGKPRQGEGTNTKIVVEAYGRTVDASSPSASARYKIGIVVDPMNPGNVAHDANPETELPITQLVSRDPMHIKPPDPNDPLGSPPNVALSLGDCHSVSHLIPPDVLTK